MPKDDRVLENFFQCLRDHLSWRVPFVETLCDRCGGPDAQFVDVSDPFPVRLSLCRPCTKWAQIEAQKEYSGELGLAAIYALAVATALRSRPVKGAGGEARQR